MVELIWKGKDTAGTQHCASPENYQSHYLHICETFNTNQYNDQSNSTDNPRCWHNRLVHGDKSHVLPALLPEFAGKVDLIYIDPPFMTGRTFTLDGKLAYSDTWNNLDAYIQWLYETLALLYRLLANDGSLYVHLDWRVIHYARVILDEIFGCEPNARGPGFKNEIIWHYRSGGRSTKGYARKHDTILLYTKSADYCFHAERIGERRGSQKRNHMRKYLNDDGHVSWTIRSAGRTYTYDEDRLMTPSDVWNDISHLHQKDPERNGYATQKPAALLERIILASSEENDLVLDCFCGSGVTPAVADQLGRRWIACDQSELAIRLTRQRLLAYKQIHPFVLQRLTENRDEQRALDEGIPQVVNNLPV
ncbi:MAG TPA: site-specific DNA-methyltransferase [Ktedonobacteraceae bacterium]|jgi:site-specific DNA-methyltransferase (adenine-specific)|nr:site-specific DNA-methyltransferase [Ktedonobacteraceae bacterium]